LDRSQKWGAIFSAEIGHVPGDDFSTSENWLKAIWENFDRNFGVSLEFHTQEWPNMVAKDGGQTWWFSDVFRTPKSDPYPAHGVGQRIDTAW
jgi:hypothetical protein